MKILMILMASMMLDTSPMTINNVSDSSDISGIWVYEGHEKNMSIYKRSEDFDKERPGLQFLENEKLVVRQNAGWCGTQSISYANFDGQYKWIDDKSLSTTYKYWGGETNKIFSIVSLDQEYLKMTMVKRD